MEKIKKDKLLQLIRKNDPFCVEEFRRFLAETHQVSLLKKTYSNAFPEIRNINTSSFWNNILKNSDRRSKNYIKREKVGHLLKCLESKSGNLLDIGLGEGILEKEIVRRKMDYSLYGVDISSYAVRATKKKVKGKFVVGSATNLPFKNNFFHAVVASELLEHISPKHTFLVLSEMFRVLKSEGMLLASVPLNENLESMIIRGENPSGHVRMYSSDLIKTELKIVGFKIEKEILLYAFRDFYYIKKFLQKTILKNRWRANDIILIAQKP